MNLNIQKKIINLEKDKRFYKNNLSQEVQKKH